MNQYTKNAEIDSGVEFSKPKPEKPPEPATNPTAAFFADLFGPDAAEDSADNSEVITEGEEDPEERWAATEKARSIKKYRLLSVLTKAVFQYYPFG